MGHMFKSIGTNWIAFKKFIGNKNIIINICRIQSYDSIMCGYFCIGLMDFMLKEKILLDYTNLFSPRKMIK